MGAKPRQGLRSGLIRTITTPLGFYVLALLIVEATLSLVLVNAQLDARSRYTGFLWMVGIFTAVVLIVTLLTIFCPRNLLYGKEEYFAPQIDPSALRDQVVDLIQANVKSECLKK